MTVPWEQLVKDTVKFLKQHSTETDTFVFYIQGTNPTKDTFRALTDKFLAALHTYPLVVAPTKRAPNVRYFDNVQQILLSDDTTPESAKLFVCISEPELTENKHKTHFSICRFLELEKHCLEQYSSSHFTKLVEASFNILCQLETLRLQTERAEEEARAEKEEKLKQEHKRREQENSNTMARIPSSLQPNVPTFDETNVQAWLDEVRELYLPYAADKDENNIAKLVTSFVPPHVKNIHNSLKTKPWAEYAAGMVRAFQTDNSMTSILDLMRMQSMKQGESIRSFLYRVDALADKADPPLSPKDRCRVFLQLLPVSLSSIMIGRSNASVKDFISTVESVMAEQRLIDPTQQSPSIGWHVAPQKQDAAGTAVGEKICALLEHLSVAEKPKLDSELDQAATKLLEFVQHKTQPPPAAEQVTTESIMKLVDDRFQAYSQQRGSGRGGSRGRGDGRGRGRGGYKPQGAYMPQGGYAPRGGYAHYQSYGPRMPRGGYVQRPYFQVQQPQQQGYQQQYQQQYQQAPPMPQQRAIMPPPQTVHQAPQPQGYQQETRVCYRCGVAGHLAYQCVQNQGF